MITELEISGFKSLKEVHLAGLRRVTLIGGRNNTGKTSVLEAFFLSRDWGNAELLSRHLGWRGVDAYAASADSARSPAFFDFKLGGKIQIRTRHPEGDRYTFTAQVLETSSAGGTSDANESKQNIRTPGQPSIRLTFTQASKTVFEAWPPVLGSDHGNALMRKSKALNSTAI